MGRGLEMKNIHCVGHTSQIIKHGGPAPRWQADAPSPSPPSPLPSLTMPRPLSSGPPRRDSTGAGSNYTNFKVGTSWLSDLTVQAN